MSIVSILESVNLYIDRNNMKLTKETLLFLGFVTLKASN